MHTPEVKEALVSLLTQMLMEMSITTVGEVSPKFSEDFRKGYCEGKSLGFCIMFEALAKLFDNNGFKHFLKHLDLSKMNPKTP